ncbi:ABC transporter permease [Cellulomonas sp. IC4_254]|uniref:ABC transporter permease n=1 Tax=Cellulomonas sp. IC4_254 TaxID=2714040 RepID=UPI001422859C|nr:ABC transporter permease [Cellulomonas sp. IC4_254]NHT19392.1 ABC transporter permease [Cellulomonas sp. IC4_254]
MSDTLTATAVTEVDADATAAPRGVWRTLRRRPLFWLCAGVLGVLLLIAVAPSWFAGWFGQPDPRACDLADSALRPGGAHVFGTDVQGCDVYANVIYGTQASLTVGVLATAVALLVAVVVGTAAGFYGGFADRLIARLTDVFLGFPFLLGAVVVLTSIGSRSAVTVALVLALFSWPTMARLVRGSVRAVRDAPYVEAAKAMGLRDRRIIARYVLPNSIGPVLAVATTMVGGVIVSESTLTFLGLGLRAPSISWGLQLSSAQTYFQTSPHMLLFPSIFLTVTVLAMITLGDVLRDVLDPKGRG